MTTPNLASEPLPPDAWRPTLDAHHPSLNEAAEAAARFVAEIASGAPPRWLTLSGVAGCGKTMLAEQIGRAAMPHNPGNVNLWQSPRRRPKVVWMDATKFASRIKSGEEYDLPEYLGDDFLVVFDDLGTARDKTDYVADATYRFCNARREGWTVFTTNLTLGEISAKVDERVASRLIRDRNQMLRITAPDYALAKRAAYSTSPTR